MRPIEHADERALVEAARHDPDAFAALYRWHVEGVHAFALRRTGSRAIAEDVTSATFERALRKLDRFRWSDRGFAPWLYRLAANEIASHYRRAARHRTPRAQAVLARSATAHEPAVDANLDDHDELRAALGTLSARHQRVLGFRFLAGLDHEQAAAAMGMSPRSFAVAVHRAKAALRAALDAQEGST